LLNNIRSGLCRNIMVRNRVKNPVNGIGNQNLIFVQRSG
jgi:hypothetical protein